MNESPLRLPICYVSDAQNILPTIVSLSSLLESRDAATAYDVHLIITGESAVAAAAVETLRRKHRSCQLTLMVSP
ncbi:MAG TPA: hypothetical protein VLC09_15875, partial [Polyangiaceae bacterium]|nr:hypothetical protein [Polyangiaceae bacterium]